MPMIETKTRQKADEMSACKQEAIQHPAFASDGRNARVRLDGRAARLMCAAGALFACTLPAFAESAKTAPSAGGAGVTVDTLLKTSDSWDGQPYRGYPAGQPELTVLRYRIPPRTALPWHTHPAPNAAYVAAGRLTVERRSDGASLTLGPGEVLPEMVDTVHRGVSGDEPLELIVFYAGAKGIVLTKPEPDRSARR